MMLTVILWILGWSLAVNSLVLNPHESRRRNNVFPDKTQIIWKTSNDKDTNDDEFIIKTSRVQPPEIPLGAKDDDPFIVPILKTENSKYKNPNNFRYSSENLQNIARKTLKSNYIAKDDTFDDEAQFIQTSTTEPSKSQGKKSFQDIADDNDFFIKPSTSEPSVYFQHKLSLSRNSLSQDSALPEHPLKSNSVIDGHMNKKSITLELTDAVSSTAQKDDDDETEDNDHNNDNDTDSNNDDNNESGDNGDNGDSNDDDDNDDNNNKDDFDNNGDDANNKNNNNDKDDENDNNDSDDDNADNDDDDASDPLSDLTKHKNWKLVNNGGDCGRNRRYTVKSIGGENADLGEYPWMARLVYTSKKEDSEKGECGGTLINKRYVLTAAHCCKDKKHGDLTYVRLGEYDIHTARDCFQGICAPSSVEVTVSSTTTHPLFPAEHDICLIQLTDDVQFTNYIQPICLPSKIQTDKKELDGKNMTVAGWGATELLPDVKLARLPDVLQELEVTVWSMEKCGQMLGGTLIDWRTLICAGGAVPAHSPCPGDSGGPLMYLDPTLDSGRQVLMGVVSNGLVCSNTIPIPSPAFYTRVSTVMPWILDTIEI